MHSGVSEVIDILDSYGLSREDLMETMQQLQFVVSSEAQLQDHFAFLVSQCVYSCTIVCRNVIINELLQDSKLKAAFTREYNSRAHVSQGLVEAMDGMFKFFSSIFSCTCILYSST